MPFEVMEIAKLYSLIQVGISYKDYLEMPASIADNLLAMHREVKDYEAYKMEQETNKIKNRR